MCNNYHIITCVLPRVINMVTLILFSIHQPKKVLMGNAVLQQQESRQHFFFYQELALY